MTRLRKISFLFLAAFLITAGYLRLAGGFIAILFSYLILEQMSVYLKKQISIFLYVLIVIGVFSTFIYAGREAVQSLPEIANRSFPPIVNFATKHGIELPFEDLEGLKLELVKKLTSELRVVVSSAEALLRQVLVLFLAVVIAISIFVNPAIDLKEGFYPVRNNQYTVFCGHLADRFHEFYRSFRTVMGAQLVISSINTLFTTAFIMIEGLPHRFVLIVATFLCGLIPVVGNVISNTMITCVALTLSPQKGAFALLFLVVLHKFEYFLNGKIIGGRIKNPMWMTLAGLIVGEYLFGIPGMILAPVVLHYLKDEFTQIPVEGN